nr:uncharacterized aarF domain-containing protein kinase 1 isoform X2 [Ipomoea batatas]
MLYAVVPIAFVRIFFSFDEEPFAAASIAQVHHALLRDHQEVAVKVQYPGLEYQMKFDLQQCLFSQNLLPMGDAYFNLFCVPLLSSIYITAKAQDFFTCDTL